MRDLLTDGRFHQRRAGQVQARTFRHQYRVAENRQIGSARHAVAHDGRVLRDARPPRGRRCCERSGRSRLRRERPRLASARRRPTSRRDRRAAGGSGAAIVWARRIFLIVIGKHAPALTVASLATTITRRPCDRADDRDDPRGDRAAPFLIHLVGGPQARARAIGEPGSSNISIRSRAVFRPLACWRSMASGPPPCLRTSLLREKLRGQGPEVLFRTAAGVSSEACHGNRVPSVMLASSARASFSASRGSVAAMIALTACWLNPL